MVIRMREKSEEAALLAQKVDDLEIALITSRAELGEAMNQINDFELGMRKKR